LSAAAAGGGDPRGNARAALWFPGNAREPLPALVVLHSKAASPGVYCDSAMPDISTLQFETVRAIAASLIVIAVVLLCVVAASDRP